MENKVFSFEMMRPETIANNINNLISQGWNIKDIIKIGSTIIDFLTYSSVLVIAERNKTE